MQGLWFVPGIVVVLFGAFAVVLVHLDEQLEVGPEGIVFEGDAAAARAVLSVLAGSLITVAGLTFSITVVVLQLASSQFSPSVLRTFFGDRLTQVTIGTFVGIFVYAVIVLRSIGGPTGGRTSVPRLSTTVASLLGIGAVILLIVFIHHVSRLIQVSHITANIAAATLDRIDSLYPEMLGRSGPSEDPSQMLESWRADELPGQVFPSRPGFVQWIALGGIVGGLSGTSRRLAILAIPGDFASPEMPLAEVWPAELTKEQREELRSNIGIGDERDIQQDIGFGLRQLTDIAIRALSPGINDPTTAVTAVGYVRAVLVELARRSFPSAVRRTPEAGDLEVFASGRGFDDYLEFLTEIGHHAGGDVVVVSALLNALAGVARVATACNAHERARQAADVAATISAGASIRVCTDRDRATVERLLKDVRRAVYV